MNLYQMKIMVLSKLYYSIVVIIISVCTGSDKTSAKSGERRGLSISVLINRVHEGGGLWGRGATCALKLIEIFVATCYSH